MLHKITLLLFSLFFFPTADDITALDFSGKVVKVKDGDTIEVLNDGKAVTIRLEGIDCPEKAQAFGQRAKEFTSLLCFGKQVKVVGKEYDQYGRLVATIILLEETHQNVNEELVRIGLAWHYKKYSSNQTLASLETGARNIKSGLWADLGTAAPPVAPWEYRKAAKQLHP